MDILSALVTRLQDRFRHQVGTGRNINILINNYFITSKNKDRCMTIYFYYIVYLKNILKICFLLLLFKQRCLNEETQLPAESLSLLTECYSLSAETVSIHWNPLRSCFLKFIRFKCIAAAVIKHCFCYKFTAFINEFQGNHCHSSDCMLWEIYLLLRNLKVSIFEVSN